MGHSLFFPDVGHAVIQILCLGRKSDIDQMTSLARCAFYCSGRVAELDDPERCFPLTAEDFARVNPNTGTAPIFRTRRDAALTTAIYARLPVLVDRSSGHAVKAWPVKYTRMFDMTNDSGLFRTRAELEEREGAWPVGGNRFASPSGDWVPLYVGQAWSKPVRPPSRQRSSLITENQHNAALSGNPYRLTPEQHRDPDSSYRTPQFWVPASPMSRWTAGVEWVHRLQRDYAHATNAQNT